MNTNNLVLQSIDEALADYAANPSNGYFLGRVSGLLSAALLGYLISEKEHDALTKRSVEIGCANYHQLEQIAA